ncbi:hypothetical protein HY636_04020 [Candidatus Woesearchaeota archaeon]|nr:hypothetical protein [Candidatus Woesearchaeota archaeon]
MKENSNEIKMNIKKSLVSMVAACWLALVPIASAKAANGSIEAMCGEKQCVQDLKVSGALTPEIGVFAREITIIDYAKQVGHFGLVDLTHKVAGGLDGVLEVQYILGLGAMPSAGAQYFQVVDELSFYVLVKSSLTEPIYGGILASVGYTPFLTQELGLTFNVENVSNLSSKGHELSEQRLRAGVTISNKLQVGAAGDIVEQGEEDQTTYNLGGFVCLKF